MKLGVFTYLDLFRLPVSLYSEGYTKRASAIGLLFSIGIFAFLIYSFLQSDMFEKTSPLVVYQSNQLQHAQRIEFNNEVLLILAVGDSYGRRFYDDSIFTVQFMYRLNATTTIYKTLKPCTLSDVEFNHSLFKALSMNGSFCLQNKSFNLEGYWDEATIMYAAINIFECNNQTSLGKCKSSQEIDAFFKDPLYPKFFAAFTHDAQIDFYDYENPMKINYRADFTGIDPNFRKRTSLFIENAHVTTDDGIFFSSLHTVSDIKFQSKESDFLLRTSKLDPYVQILVYASKEEVKCTRKYQKLPEILGSLTGSTHLIMFFGMLVCNLNTYIQTLVAFSNRLYVFPKLERNSKKNREMSTNDAKILNMKERQISPMQNSKKNNSQRSQSSRRKFNIDNNENTEGEASLKNLVKNQAPQNTRKDIEMAKNDFDSRFVKPKNEPSSNSNFFPKSKQEQKNSLKVSFFEYLEYLIRVIICMRICLRRRPKNHDHRLILKAEKAFRKDMDIANIVTKLHDLEKLKILLLNEDQLVLFNYLSKPAIAFDEKEHDLHGNSLNESHMAMSKLRSVHNTKKTANQIEECFKRVHEERLADPINLRLTELFDQTICFEVKTLMEKN